MLSPCRRELCLLLIALGLSACGNSQTAAGGGASEIPNAIAARVTLDNGTPLAKQPVVLTNSRSWYQSIEAHTVPAYDTVFTDGNGNLSITNGSPGDYSILVLSGSEGAIQPLTNFTGIAPANSIQLKKLGILRGTIPTAPVGSLVRISNTSLVDTLGADHGFVLNGVPPGPRGIIVTLGNTWTPWATATVFPGIDYSVQPAIPADTNGLLLDGFDDAGGKPAVAGFLNMAQWSTSSSFGPDSSNLTVSTLTSGCALGSCLGIEYNTAGKTASVSLSLEPGLDLRGLDSITFNVQGRGSVRVSLGGATAMVMPQVPWTRMSLVPGAFSSLPGSSVTSFQIILGDTTSGWLQLDEIRLHGDSRRMLSRSP